MSRRRSLGRGPTGVLRTAVHVAGRAVVTAELLGAGEVARADITSGPRLDLVWEHRPVEAMEVGELIPRAAAQLGGLAAEDGMWSLGATFFATLIEVLDAIDLVDEWIARGNHAADPSIAEAIVAWRRSPAAGALGSARRLYLERVATIASGVVIDNHDAIRRVALQLLDWGALREADVREVIAASERARSTRAGVARESDGAAGRPEGPRR